ncbi:MAG: hypothetical protein ACJAUQ_000618 [Maribacter sp.]|jgi:hypothetical protein
MLGHVRFFLNSRLGFMGLICKNNYVATYLIENSLGTDLKRQLMVDTIGLFMSENDLK